MTSYDLFLLLILYQQFRRMSKAFQKNRMSEIDRLPYFSQENVLSFTDPFTKQRICDKMSKEKEAKE